MAMRLLAVHPGAQLAPPLSDVLTALGLPTESLALDARAPEGELIAEIAQAVRRETEVPLGVVGFSLGARLAVTACEGASVLGLVGLSFPFHKRGCPQARHGFEALAKLAAPMLIVQGARDSHGSRATAGRLRLPALARVHWLADANHAWRTRESSTHSHEAHVKDAASAISEFFEGLVQARHG